MECFFTIDSPGEPISHCGIILSATHLSSPAPRKFPEVNHLLIVANMESKCIVFAKACNAHSLLCRMVGAPPSSTRQGFVLAIPQERFDLRIGLEGLGTVDYNAEEDDEALDSAISSLALGNADSNELHDNALAALEKLRNCA